LATKSQTGIRANGGDTNKAACDDGPVRCLIATAGSLRIRQFLMRGFSNRAVPDGSIEAIDALAFSFKDIPDT
jgi:hypothetical protein